MGKQLPALHGIRQDWDNHTKHRAGGKWVISKDKPTSLDFSSVNFYRPDEPYQVLVDDIRTAKGLLHKLEHLSGKVWFDPDEFLQAAAAALDVRY